MDETVSSISFQNFKSVFRKDIRTCNWSSTNSGNAWLSFKNLVGKYFVNGRIENYTKITPKFCNITGASNCILCITIMMRPRKILMQLVIRKVNDSSRVRSMWKNVTVVDMMNRTLFYGQARLYINRNFKEKQPAKVYSFKYDFFRFEKAFISCMNII